MTNAEFSDMFSTLLNSYNTQAQFGEQASKAEIVLDEYEKSVLLTQAQDLIVKSYFDRTLNNQGQGFDDSTRRQVDFSSLIKVAKISSPTSSVTVTTGSTTTTSGTSASYTSEWRDSTGSLGNVTITNVSGSNLTVTVQTVTTGNAVAYSLNGNALVISLNPEELMDTLGSGQTTMQGLIDYLNTTGNSSALTDIRSKVTFSYSGSSARIPGYYEGGGGSPTYSAVTLVNGVSLGTGVTTSTSTTTQTVSADGFDSRGSIFKLPTYTATLDEGGDGKEHSDVLFILNEKIVYLNKEYVVIPISYAEYDREMSKPYAQPLKKQAWRLFQNMNTEFDMYSEIIPKWFIAKDTTNGYVYKIRYVRRPKPIILEDLPNDLTVDGYQNQRECELNPILHIDILNKAVELAITTRGGSAPSSYDRTAQRSESR